MPYITRDDGERFVIPSYRDVISAKKTSLLVREIMLLSTNYGEYITLQKKNLEQYEVAFSADPGYLLGETVWHYFKRPLDLIYCEAIPNTSEAILVIVKSGSVYLDGSFSMDAIEDELVIFRTQQNNFDIYVYGDVPISNTPEEGKFCFDSSSVRSFQFLDEPAFAKLPRVKTFQLQPVDVVLKSQGIGVLPVKMIAIIGVVILALYLGYSWITSHKKALPTTFVGYVVNPYQYYIDTLSTPDPVQEIHRISDSIKMLYTMPGWSPGSLEYSKGKYSVSVHSPGATTKELFDWARAHNTTVIIKPDGFYLTWSVVLPARAVPKAFPQTSGETLPVIYKLNEVIGNIVDKLALVLPGNHLSLGTFQDKRYYAETAITISFVDISPELLTMIGMQLQNLPLALSKASITMSNGNISGSIVLQALGLGS